MIIIIAKNVETWKSVFYFITPLFKLHCAKFWKAFRKALYIQVRIFNKIVENYVENVEIVRLIVLEVFDYVVNGIF